MEAKSLFALLMVLAVVSFIGFVVENVWLAATKGYMDNRNAFFPFLMGYGIAILLIHIIVGTPKKLWLFGKVLAIKSMVARKILFLVAAILCVCVGEIILGTLVEKFCHFSWWDYSRLPLHITKYTSIPTSIAFGLLISVFMEYCFEPLYWFFMEWKEPMLSFWAISITALMTWDFVYHGIKMYQQHGIVKRWRIDTTSWRVYRRLHEVDVVTE